MDKLFKVGQVYELTNMVGKGEITFGRMVEILNEMVDARSLDICQKQKVACCQAALVETMEDDGTITASRHKEIAGHIVAINRQSILNTKNVVYELD